jgi:hypothetical protein
MYGVVWNCPEGHGPGLDICPIGPLVPEADSCLNCGANDQTDETCAGCGLTRQTCLDALGLSPALEADPIETARSAFAQGLFRRGLAILNRALQDGRAPPEAWFAKSRFMNSIGYNRSAAEMIEAALRATTDERFRSTYSKKLHPSGPSAEGATTRSAPRMRRLYSVPRRSERTTCAVVPWL